MDVLKFYENIILRDLLEYTVPGAVVIIGLGVVTQVLLGRIQVDLFGALRHYQSFAFVVAVFGAYVIGHILAAIHALLFRPAEERLASKVLDANPWLKQRVAQAITRQFCVSQTDAHNLIDQGRMLRELARSIVHANAQQLYREFVNRHSVLSRFCQNLRLAIWVFLAACSVSAFIDWHTIWPVARNDGALVAMAITAVVVLIAVGEILRLNCCD